MPLRTNKNLIISFFLLLLFIANCGESGKKVSMRYDYDELKVDESALEKDSIYYGIHAQQGWAKLPISFKVGQSLTSSQKNGLIKAMNSWQIAIGKKVFEFKGVDSQSGDDFGDLYSSLLDDKNSYYLDSDWKKTGKSDFVLATTIWANDEDNLHKIKTADIRFNNEFYTFTNSFDPKVSSLHQKDIVDMQTLALHELGHLLGLSHVDDDIDHNSVMNESLYIGQGFANRVPSREDVKRIQSIYGCFNDACDIDQVMKKLELNAKDDL